MSGALTAVKGLTQRFGTQAITSGVNAAANTSYGSTTGDVGSGTNDFGAVLGQMQNQLTQQFKNQVAMQSAQVKFQEHSTMATIVASAQKESIKDSKL